MLLGFSGPDGGFPFSSLAYYNGTFYGTTTVGGLTGAGVRDSGHFAGYGAVFGVSKVSGKYAETYQYPFHNGPADGANPNAGVVIDASGNIYGTTTFGGSASSGAVFKLAPLPSGGFAESLIYSFKGLKKKDGADPYAQLLMDSSGALYGTTANGGASACSGGCGTVFKLTPTGSTFTETLLHVFQGTNDGHNPYAGLVADASGALYGTTVQGGTADDGVAFKLTPSKATYTETVMHSFAGGSDGAELLSPLALGPNGVLYGTTYNGGSTTCGGGCGTAFALTPSGSGYVESNVYLFQGGSDGLYPRAGLTVNKTALYGTTYSGGKSSACFGSGCGSIFKLTPTKTGFTKTIIYDFRGGNDGAQPSANLMLQGTLLYGTTYAGGGANCFTDDGTCGTVFSIKP
jgi:uncharacterized repeat protein (TIGR03803 family)